MYNGKVIRSSDIKDVIHIKVKKFAGYFNPESRSFAVDPHLTTFEDLQKILIEAFNLSGPFHITYLCRDDAGENVFLSMLTDWDLDAAFMTSSEPYLRLKLDAEPYKDGLMTKMRDWETAESPGSIFRNQSNIVKNILQPVTKSTLFQNTQKSWMNSFGGAINKLTAGWNNNTAENSNQSEDFFPAKPPLDDAEFRSFLDEDGRLRNPESLRLRVYNGGVAPALRKVIWRLLLNIFPENLTGQERIDFIKKKSGDLFYYLWHKNFIVSMASLDQYEELRAKWQAKAGSERVKHISNMVWKDVLRTDRSHAFFKGPDDNPNILALMNILTTFALTHPKISYCQGMSDLVSPIFMVMNNEAQAYVCFCGLMSRMQGNFTSHGKAMSTKFKHLAFLVKRQDPDFYQYLQSLGADNMFFCYRWILLEMKREFSFDDAITVLEVIWSSLPPQPPDSDLPLEDYPQGASFCEEEHQVFSEEEVFEDTERSTRLDLDYGVENNNFDRKNKRTAKETLVKRNYRKPDESSKSLQKESRKSATESNIALISNRASYGDELALEGDVDFQNPRSEKRTLDTKLENSSLASEPLPPPEELGCGHPFLLFVCFAVLEQERDQIMVSKMEYDDMVMHFDKMVRKRSPKKVLSKAMRRFAEYLRSDNFCTSSST